MFLPFGTVTNRSEWGWEGDKIRKQLVGTGAVIDEEKGKLEWDRVWGQQEVS